MCPIVTRGFSHCVLCNPINISWQQHKSTKMPLKLFLSESVFNHAIQLKMTESALTSLTHYSSSEELVNIWAKVKWGHESPRSTWHGKVKLLHALKSCSQRRSLLVHGLVKPWLPHIQRRSTGSYQATLWWMIWNRMKNWSRLMFQLTNHFTLF